MEILHSIGAEDVATVYVARTRLGLIEFAESCAPDIPQSQKWILTISCLVGCPVRCLMCDAGQRMDGALSREEMLAQIDHMVDRRYSDRRIPVTKWKVQFARMGEPAFNPAVVDALAALPERYDAPGLIASLSTIGPRGCTSFFARLKEVKERFYDHGRFQFQFSVHTTDPVLRDRLIPVPKLSFPDIARLGQSFVNSACRKVTLNFMVMEDYPVDPDVVARHFDPSVFLVKLTPLNPTHTAQRSRLRAKLSADRPDAADGLAQRFRALGYDTIVSIGDPREDRIGSNCGQFVSAQAARQSFTLATSALFAASRAGIGARAGRPSSRIAR